MPHAKACGFARRAVTFGVCFNVPMLLRSPALAAALCAVLLTGCADSTPGSDTSSAPAGSNRAQSSPTPDEDAQALAGTTIAVDPGHNGGNMKNASKISRPLADRIEPLQHLELLCAVLCLGRHFHVLSLQCPAIVGCRMQKPADLPAALSRSVCASMFLCFCAPPLLQPHSALCF